LIVSAVTHSIRDEAAGFQTRKFRIWGVRNEEKSVFSGKIRRILVGKQGSGGRDQGSGIRGQKMPAAAIALKFVLVLCQGKRI
jgi:hypothetical protein